MVVIRREEKKEIEPQLNIDKMNMSNMSCRRSGGIIDGTASLKENRPTLFPLKQTDNFLIYQNKQT